MGSPPHTWRILSHHNFRLNNLRITSTYVENTLLTCKLMDQLKDHLHIRGEYICFHCKNSQVWGSPPHTWRILRSIQTGKGAKRITSTYVENTWFHLKSNVPVGDHLHIRGEYEMLTIVCHVSKGSPPHTWRIPFVKLSEGTGYRITSTYVENTLFSFSSISICKDHLHIRGEYNMLPVLIHLGIGSPPHTWRIRG